MVTDRINEIARSSIRGHVYLLAGFTGAGAAQPTVSANSELATVDNFASTRGGVLTTITRNGAGDVTYILPSAPARVLNVSASSHGATDLECTVRAWSITANRLTVQVKTWSPAGVATDLANGTDFLRIAIDGSDSTV